MSTVAIVLVISMVALVGYVLTRPDHFRVERSIDIAAPAEAVFAHLDSFRAWAPWSPWEAIDPQLQRHYDGPERGPGASYRWLGNREVGEGRMTIVEASPPRLLRIELEFTAPFKARNTVEFVLSERDGRTHVSQAMFGPSPFLSKLIGLVFDMDKMVGGKYEQGLASLKRLAEARPQPPETPGRS